MAIIDGKSISARVKTRAAALAGEFFNKTGRRVGLAVVRVGDDPASLIYVKNKLRACEACGIRSVLCELKESSTQEDVVSAVKRLNADETVDGILVQLPLPRHIDERAVLSELSPEKDADGFHTVNAGKLFLGEGEGIVSCTPRGIMELITSTGASIRGKHAVVVGRSNIVGKPVAALLLAADATVTVCHSKTVDIASHTRSADILVAAVGKKHFITADMVKPGAIVIDVGINRTEDGLFGDVDFDKVKDVAAFITPVPGGVGPMTVAMLMLNTAEIAMRGIKECKA